VETHQVNGHHDDASKRAEALSTQGDASDDSTRLRLLEDLYRKLEEELERDLGEGPQTRR
jgi:hypothetical protein